MFLSCFLFCFRLQISPSVLISSLDLLPEEIFGTDEVPVLISSDSSAEEEDATPEQKVNHQLRRRIRHPEHDLRNESIGHWAERERRMRLEMEIGSKIFCSSLIFHFYADRIPSFDGFIFSLSFRVV